MMVNARHDSARYTRLMSWFMIAAGAAPLLAEVRPLPEAQRISVATTEVITFEIEPPLRMPTDVAVDREGRLILADGVNQRLIMRDAEDKSVRVIEKVAGTSLDNPVGLTLDRRNALWIADAGHGALFRLTEAQRDSREGGTRIPLPTSDNGRACDVTDVAVSQDGSRVWIVDNDHHRLLFRDGESGTWTPVGTAGNGVGQFQWPFMLAMGPDDVLFVTEAIGSRVQQVTPELRWRGQIGRWGVQPGELYRPKGIAVDADKRIYVTDSTLGVVQVFAPDGKLHGVLTDRDGRPTRFEHPMGLTFDSQGRLYVVEMQRHAVRQVTLTQPPTVQQPATPPASSSDDGKETP